MFEGSQTTQRPHSRAKSATHFWHLTERGAQHDATTASLQAHTRNDAPNVHQKTTHTRRWKNINDTSTGFQLENLNDTNNVARFKGNLRHTQTRNKTHQHGRKTWMHMKLSSRKKKQNKAKQRANDNTCLPTMRRLGNLCHLHKLSMRT